MIWKPTDDDVDRMYEHLRKIRGEDVSCLDCEPEDEVILAAWRAIRWKVHIGYCLSGVLIFVLYLILMTL